VPHTVNVVGNGNQIRGSSSTPKACVAWDWRRQAISSTPQACGVLLHHPRPTGASAHGELDESTVAG